MSFLDSLENNLKAMESRLEGDIEQARLDQEARRKAAEAERAAAPYSEALRNGPFTQNLLRHCRTIGHGMRTLVRITWIEGVLRLEAKEKRLQLAPTAEGIRATYQDGGEVTGTGVVDLSGDPEKLARQWLES